MTTLLRRPRRLITASILLVITVALGVNTALVDGQAAGGDDIHLTQDGPLDAPALVLIHGLGASTRWWDPVVPLLAGSYRVIRVDLLGHGRSGKPAGGGYAIPDQARRIARALDRLGVRHALLVGHSTGGYVATSLAEQRGDLVTALALVDTGPRMDAFISDGPVGKLLDVPVVGQLLWRLRTDGLIRRGLSSAFAPGFTAPQQAVDDTRAMTYHSLTAASHASDDYLGQRAMPERLTPPAKPLLVIFGEQDRRWRPASAGLYRAVPGATVEMIPGAGHSPMLENPPRTAAVLLAFAGRVLAGR